MFGKDKKNSNLRLKKQTGHNDPQIVYTYSYREQFGQEASLQQVRQFFGETEGGLLQQIYDRQGNLLNSRQFRFSYTAGQLQALWEEMKPYLVKLSKVSPLYNPVKNSAKSSLNESLNFVMPIKHFSEVAPLSFWDAFSKKSAELHIENANAQKYMMSISAHEQFLGMRCLIDKEFYRNVPRKEVQVKTDYQLNQDESLLVMVNDFIVDTVKSYGFPNLKKRQNYLLSDAYKIKVIKAKKHPEFKPVKREVLFEEETDCDFSKIAILPNGLKIK